MHIWIDARSPYAFEQVYSITLIERVLRQLFELGVRNNVTIVLQPEMPLDRYVRKDFWPRYHIEFDTFHSQEPLSSVVQLSSHTSQPFILLEGDGIYDERILKKLFTSTHSLAITNEHNKNAPLAAVLYPKEYNNLNANDACIQNFLHEKTKKGSLKIISIYDMDSYIPSLRQNAVPLLIRLQNRSCIRAIENKMYEQTFKGVMDVIATYIYRIPVRGLVRWLAPTRITPNQITAMSVLCSFAAIPLFAMGWMWAGLAVAFTFILADSLDGKLARLTVRLSKAAGHVDHVTSPLFEACYYLAWGWYFSDGDFTTRPGQAGLLLFGFYGLDKITTSIFGLQYGRSLLDYTTWDARFHRIAARRTINLCLMAIGCLLQRPITALYAITVWMGLTMLWHMFRFALHASRHEAQ